MSDKLFSCARCRSEGNAVDQTIDAFYVWVSARGSFRRSAYCKKHMIADSSRRIKQRVDPASRRYDRAFHERKKATNKAYMQRKRAEARLRAGGDAQ